MSRRRNKLKNVAGHTGLFFRHEYVIFKIAHIGSCTTSQDQFLLAKVVYFSALPLSVSAPSLPLLWRRHCYYISSKTTPTLSNSPILPTLFSLIYGKFRYRYLQPASKQFYKITE